MGLGVAHSLKAGTDAGKRAQLGSGLWHLGRREHSETPSTLNLKP